MIVRVWLGTGYICCVQNTCNTELANGIELKRMNMNGYIHQCLQMRIALSFPPLPTF